MTETRSESGEAADDELTRLRAELAGCKAELEQTRSELHASRGRKALLRSLLDSLPALVYYQDLEGRYLGCNQAFADFVGLEGEILGWTTDEIYLTPYTPESWARERAAITAGQTLREELWHAERASLLEVTKAPYIVDGQVTGMLGIARDISELKQAEMSLRISEARTRQILDTVPIGILVVTADGKPSYSNPHARQILGTDVDLEAEDYKPGVAYQTYNSDTGELYDFEELPLIKALRGEYAHARNLESRRGERVLFLEATAAPIFDEDGTLVSAITVFNDISESKRKENELIEARERAEAANRAKGDFLANMSHEIRTPLHAIIGFNQLLLRTSLDARQQDYVRNNQQAARNLLSIINDILDMSKIEAGMLRIETTAFDLRQVLDQLFRLLSRQAQDKSLELVLQLAPELPTALIGDPLRLEQVLLNLVGNAIKFTEAGEVSLKIGIVKPNETEDEDETVLSFEINDTGIGIAPEQQARLFQAFAQADSSTTRKYGGSGLGLTISRHLVNLMGGRLGFTSLPGEGSCFRFTAHFGSQSTAQARPSGGLGQLRVLVIDDHQVVIDVMTEYLQRFGLSVDSWLAGKQSSEQLQNLARRPYDLILIDWNLPTYSQADLLGPFFDRSRPPKLVLMTGSAPEKLAQADFSRAHESVLFKPIQPSHLYDMLSTLFPEQLKADAPFQEPDPSILAPLHGARLLLVEDNAVNQRLACELLQAHGFIVDVANDGREGLEQLSRQAYDLVLMDLQMPVMDGYSAAQEIRRRPEFARLPIVAMTADAVTGVREQVLDVGMNDYITKPIELASLFEALLRWIKPRNSLTEQTSEQAPVLTTATPPEPEKTSTNGPLARLEHLQSLELKSALRRAAGNAALLLELLEDFAFNLPEQLEALNEALQNDRAEAAQIAHALRGTAANLGLTALQEALTEIEQSLRQNRPSDLSEVDRSARQFLLELADG